jgi:hypothetical protein
VGYRYIDGPVNSNRVTATLNYRMSDKWIVNAGAAYDFADRWNLRESISVTRIGESALFQLGLNYDHSQDNVGVTLGIEPRILAGKLSRVGGVPLPPVGTLGLE